MQKTHDRLKITAEDGVLASDRRLPFRVLRSAEIVEIEGRVLVTGQDEASGRNFVLVESIRGEVLQVPQVREFENLRQRGGLKAGSYLRMRAQRDSAVELHFEIADFSDATMLLSDQAFLSQNAARLLTEMPDGWSGWLGNLRNSALQAAEVRPRTNTLTR